MAKSSFSINAATYDDVPALAKIWDDSFEDDRHTQMKNQGKVPYDMEKLGKSVIPHWLGSEKHVIIKAVDNETGASMGWLVWGFRGFEENEMPSIVGAPHKGDQPVSEESKDKKDEAEKEEKPDEREDSIKKLEALTNQDREDWTAKLMPPGTKCMFVTTLSVAPAHQKRGVGSALLKWGTDVADKANVFIWVHSSEGAAGAYEKSGFKVIGELDVDLDEFAPNPPTDGTDKWGHYVFKYMKYLPKA